MGNSLERQKRAGTWLCPPVPALKVLLSFESQGEDVGEFDFVAVLD